MRPSHLMIVGFIAIAACSAPRPDSGFGDDEANASGKKDGPSGSFGDGTTTGPDGKPTAACVKDKGNYDIPGNNCDDDGDGKVDNPPTCDASIAEAASAEDFAKAMGICESANGQGFGLVSATFTRGYKRTDAPKPQQHGVLSKFGNVLKPREGARLGVLSTGYAQEFDGSQGTSFGGGSPGVDWFNARPGAGNGSAPPGFPKPAAGCPGATTVNDVVNLKLELRAPKNASGFKFDFNFHSGEWPAYICSEFNDGFVAYLTSSAGSDNISFDSKKNPVSVNNGFFDRCTPNAKIGCLGGSPGTSQCPGGVEELAGTGFGVSGKYCGPTGGTTVSGGATGWLSSQAPVKAGETFTLELMIWDTGDGDLDSSVLLDNFQWIAGQVTTSTERPANPR